MKASGFAAKFMLALAAFMILEWLILVKNLGIGPRRSTAFSVIHGILIAVNLAPAIAFGVLGRRAYRAPRGR